MRIKYKALVLVEGVVEANSIEEFTENWLNLAFDYGNYNLDEYRLLSADQIITTSE